MAPAAAQVIPIAEVHAAYAERVAQTLRATSARIEVDASSETLNARARNAQRWKVPLTLVVGAQEEANGTVSVRPRGQRDSIVIPLDLLTERLDRALRDRQGMPNLQDL
jgi:threonyl-tRNA synthetase